MRYCTGRDHRVGFKDSCFVPGTRCRASGSRIGLSDLCPKGCGGMQCQACVGSEKAVDSGKAHDNGSDCTPLQDPLSSNPAKTRAVLRLSSSAKHASTTAEDGPCVGCLRYRRELARWLAVRCASRPHNNRLNSRRKAVLQAS